MSDERGLGNLLVWIVVQAGAGRVLLGRRDGSASGHGWWGLPGGQVESGEGLPEAAVRELHEEMELEVDPVSLSVLGVRRYGVDGARGVDFVLIALDASGTSRPLHKTSEVAWFAPSHCPEDALPCTLPVLDAFLNGGACVAEQLTAVGAVRPLSG